MSNQANILIASIVDLTTGYLITTSATVATDGTMTPAGPDKPGSAVFVYENRVGGIAALYPKYSLSVRRPQNGSRAFKITEKYVHPVPNISSPSTGSGIQPLPSVGYSLVYTGEYIIPDVSSLSDRTAFLSVLMCFRTRGITASDNSPSVSTATPLFDAVLNLEPIY